MFATPKKPYTFTWVVEDFFLSCKSTGQSVDSPPFTVDSLGSTTYRLKLYPRGLTDDKWVSLRLVRSDYDDGTTRVNFGMRIVVATEYYRIPVNVSCEEKDFGRSNAVVFPELVERCRLLMHCMGGGAEDRMVVRCHMWEIPSDRSHHPETTWRTTVTAKKVKVPWVVANLESFEESKLVSLKDGSDLVELVLKKKDGRLMLDLKLLHEARPVFLYFEVKFLDILGEHFAANGGGRLFDSSTPQVWSFPDCLIELDQFLEEPDRLLPDGDLHMRVELAFSDEYEEHTVLHDAIHETSPLSLKEVTAKGYLDSVMSQQDLLQAFLEKKGCDIQLVSNDGRRFSAHRSVLCNKSRVFRYEIFSSQRGRAIVNGGVDEGVSDLPVPALDGDTLHEFLLFLYADQVQDLCFETAVRLYGAATLYAVHSLAQLCDTYIKFRVVHEDLAEVVEEGAKNHPSVKKVAREIAKRRRDIFDTTEGEKVAENKREELLEVYGGLAKKRKLAIANRQVPKEDLLVAQAQEWLDSFQQP